MVTDSMSYSDSGVVVAMVTYDYVVLLVVLTNCF